jgi:hypothetical protein
MNFEYGIYKSKQTLSGKTADEIFEMVDTVCKVPLPFSHSGLVGLPINSIFI